MYIKNINIGDFGGMHERTIDFGNSLNLVCGNNESGKSTISAFIRFMLFGFKDKQERMRYYSWNTTSAHGTMTVVQNGKTYRIERSHAENSGAKVVIIDCETSSPLPPDVKPSAIFADGADETLFEHTAYVGQASGGRVNGDSISKYIENILFSADESTNTDKALKKLDEARTQLLYKNRRGGKISELAEERDSLSVALREASIAGRETIEKEGALREVKEELAKIGSQIEYLHAQIELYEKATAANRKKKLSSLKKNIHELELVVGVLKKKYTYDDFLPDEDYINSLKNISREIEELDIRVDEFTAQVNELNKNDTSLFEYEPVIDNISEHGGQEEVFARLDKYKKSKRSTLLNAVTLYVLAVMSAVGAGATIYLRLDYRIPLACAVVFGVSLLAAVICTMLNNRVRMNESALLMDFDADSPDDLRSLLRRAGGEETHLRLHKARVADISEKRKKLEDRIEEQRAAAYELLGKWGRTDLADTIAKGEEALRLIKEKEQELNSYRMALATLADEDSRSELPSDDILQDFDETLPVPNAEQTAQNRGKYFELQKRFEAYRNTKTELERSLAVLSATTDDPCELATQLKDIKNDISVLTARHKAYVLAHEKLTAASYSLRHSIAPILSTRAGELMGYLTDRKYTSIGVQPSLEMQYFSDGTHSIDYMSEGTRDLAYVSLRFALTELLFPKGGIPVIFDESFARLDDIRLTKMLSLVADASKGAQVIILTSQTREGTIMDEQDITCNRIGL